jgi:hypothetical protein
LNQRRVDAGRRLECRYEEFQVWNQLDAVPEHIQRATLLETLFKLLEKLGFR